MILKAFRDVADTTPSTWLTGSSILWAGLSTKNKSRSFVVGNWKASLRVAVNLDRMSSGSWDEDGRQEQRNSKPEERPQETSRSRVFNRPNPSKDQTDQMMKGRRKDEIAESTWMDEGGRGEDQRTIIYTRPTGFQEKAWRETKTTEPDKRHQRRERVEEVTKYGTVRRRPQQRLHLDPKYRRDCGESTPR